MGDKSGVPCSAYDTDNTDTDNTATDNTATVFHDMEGDNKPRWFHDMVRHSRRPRRHHNTATDNTAAAPAARAAAPVGTMDCMHDIATTTAYTASS
jgi:hypothetical protein